MLLAFLVFIPLLQKEKMKNNQHASDECLGTL